MLQYSQILDGDLAGSELYKKLSSSVVSKKLGNAVLLNDVKRSRKSLLRDEEILVRKTGKF